MPVTYTNRKGRKYYLCQGFTKTGKSRYYFSREQKGEPVERIPAGYEITESVNGIVSLSKIRPKLLTDEEIAIVEDALEKHPKAKKYRLNIKGKEITIYEQVGPDVQELAAMLVEQLGYAGVMTKEFGQRMKAEQEYIPVMKLILADADKRLFDARRMCYLGRIDDWIDIERSKSIDELTTLLIPKLGTERFFELY